MTPERFAHVQRCIDVIRAGGMVVMVDDEDRENEGDLVVSAQHCTAETINFMSKEGRGLICLALTPERVEELRLPMMVRTDPGSMGTAFTVSVEARHGVSTGISAADRARTVQVAADARFGAEDIVSPGHIFPLRAKPGGVLVRSGHTEGAVDISRFAGSWPAGVICEIMKDDGTMARMEDLRGFASKHGLEIVAIADLIQYRLRSEILVEETARDAFASPLLGIDPSAGWSILRFRSKVDPVTRAVALIKGDISGSEERPVLLRAQRAALLGDVFGFGDDSASRLRCAVAQIDREGRGVLLWVVPSGLEHELDLGQDAHGAPGLRPHESGFRDFGLGAQVLSLLGVRRIRVITNHARKIIGLEGFGIEVVEAVPMEGA
jgi:3,4-dihydroxy 2-butanone 4-phosphate synthase/GTP cyclohydrolase II